MSEQNAAGISLVGVNKRFEKFEALRDLDLSIRPGEFFSLLGPSGCGKTTTLRIIAGFEAANEGRILFDERDMTDVPVHKRNIGMIFQSYALLPHRTVRQNIAFGLRMRGVQKAEIDRRVDEAISKVALDGLADRRPAQLSGGQQQRVALARAIVIRPTILLCDEPFAALDRKLRRKMQLELKALQKEINTTLVFVTHDQEEAMTMSDRIAVMNRGVVEQVGSPQEIYDAPHSRFVADFIGDTNLIEARAAEGGTLRVGTMILPGGERIPAGTETTVAVRPEKMKLCDASGAVLTGRVASVSYLGGVSLVHVETDRGQTIAVRQSVGEASPLRQPGEQVGVSWLAEDTRILPN